MKRFYIFLREKGFYLALGVGIVAFAALIFLYDYKEAGSELSREQAIDLNKARQPEDIADASDADVNKESDSRNEKEENAASETTEEKKKVVTKEEGADGEEIQNIAGVNSDRVADASSNEVKDEKKKDGEADTDGKAQNEVVETAAKSSISQRIDELDYDGTQGLLWPIEGEVIMPFSMETTTYYKTLDMYKVNPGIMIAADEGENVFSAYQGIVEAVKETKEYGAMVIVNLGNGYKATYGQLMNIAVKPGDEVAKATIVGQVAPVSDYFKKEGSNLFFEVTKENQPVNPVTLID